MQRMKQKKKAYLIIIPLVILTALACVAVYVLGYYNLLPSREYCADDFNIATLQSTTDYNGNGVDDYTDIMLGARLDAENQPAYNGGYYKGGYPPNNIGVCSDVVWRAFKNAGYCLRDMIAADVAARPGAYLYITSPNADMDFRSVRNLRAFFEEYAVALTLNPDEIDQWQPGDIVIFGIDEHIGIVSDKRNSVGRTYILHNYGQPNREEDYFRRNTDIAAHYRFDASVMDSALLFQWY